MYALLLILLSLVLLVILAQFSGLAALVFALFVLVSTPALIIHRREARSAVEIGPEAQHVGRGWLRLAGLLSLDAAGVALAVLVFLLLLLASHLGFGHHSH